MYSSHSTGAFPFALARFDPPPTPRRTVPYRRLLSRRTSRPTLQRTRSEIPRSVDILLYLYRKRTFYFFRPFEKQERVRSRVPSCSVDIYECRRMTPRGCLECSSPKTKEVFASFFCLIAGPQKKDQAWDNTSRAASCSCICAVFGGVVCVATRLRYVFAVLFSKVTESGALCIQECVGGACD